MVLEVVKGRNTFRVILDLWLFGVRLENGEPRGKDEDHPTFWRGVTGERCDEITRIHECARSIQNVLLSTLRRVPHHRNIESTSEA